MKIEKPTYCLTTKRLWRGDFPRFHPSLSTCSESESGRVLLGRREDAGALLGCGAGGGEAKGLLDVLSNAHSAEHVEEDEGALGVVLPRQVPVAKPLQEGDGREGEVGHHAPFENGIEHGKYRRKGDTNEKQTLHFHHRKVPVGGFELFFIFLKFLLLFHIRQVSRLFLLFNFLALSLHFSLQPLECFSSVHHKPGEPFTK